MYKQQHKLTLIRQAGEPDKYLVFAHRPQTLDDGTKLKRPVSGVVATVPLETVSFGNIKDVRRRVLRVPAEIVPNVEPTYWLDGREAVQELRKYEEQIDRWLDGLADDEYGLDDEESADEPDEPDETLGPPCPVCGVDCQFDKCNHVVSTWSYTGEGGEQEGEWSGSEFVLEEFKESVQELYDAVGEMDEPEMIVPKLIPKRLHSLLDDYFWSDMIGHCCNDHLYQLVESHPRFVGSEWCQTDGMASSMWEVYFAQDGAECASDVDAQLEKDIASIRKAIKRLMKEAGEDKGESSIHE
jgi:hypothetical protein